MLFEILQFINEQNQRRFRLPGCIPDHLNQGLQIQLQVTIVRKPRFGVEVQTDFDICITNLKRFDKSRQTTQGAMSQIACLFHPE